MNKLNPKYKTLTSKYGYGGVDVRKTYEDLPLQLFWTWVTGKALPTGAPRKPKETVLTKFQFCAHVCYSWSLIFGSIFTAAMLDNLIVSTIAIVLVTNRTRGLLHTFHYTIHGASVTDMKFARWFGKYFINIPIMHTPWSVYRKLHVIDHHSKKILCTNEDPDQIFMINHGFHASMNAKEFWLKIFLSPFHPARIYEHMEFRLKSNFVYPETSEIIPRAIFWVLFIAGIICFDVVQEALIYYLFPLFILTQYSSYIQHIVEHLWFPKKPKNVDPKVYYASLTWGRFLGRPYPEAKNYHRKYRLLYRDRMIFFAKVVLIDIPIRIFSFMQDLPSHDFHHRSPGVNFWRIPYERANSENRETSRGPMTETWSLWESILILRDHLVYGEFDPFGVYAWSIETKRQSEVQK